jgi:hypothetical protein
VETNQPNAICEHHIDFTKAIAEPGGDYSLAESFEVTRGKEKQINGQN